MSADKTLTCRDCTTQFVFTVREQEFFAEKGFGDPVRCIACRRALKAKRTDGEGPAANSGPRPGGERPGSDRPGAESRGFSGDRPRREGGYQGGGYREGGYQGGGYRDRGPRPDRPAPTGPPAASDNSDEFPELRPNYRAEPAMAGGSRDTGPRFRERGDFREDYPKKRKKLNSGRPRPEDDGTGWEE